MEPVAHPPPDTSAVAWRTLDVRTTVKRLGTAVRTGLSSAESTMRLDTHGPNRLQAG
jgi:hypothetical protein